MTNLETFLYWIQERESIREKKEAGEHTPWTSDQILQKYKFCNVKRQDDRVTRWLFENWYGENQHHKNTWFAACVARLINWPDSLEAIGFPVVADLDWLEAAVSKLKHRRDNSRKIFTGAYLVSTNGVSMDKIDYIFDHVLRNILAKGRPPVKGETLESYWEHLTQFDGLGSFMAGQVIADLKHTDSNLQESTDWWTFAPLGPGSKRGLNRVHDRPVTASVSQTKGGAEILKLQEIIEQRLGFKLAAHNVQNCLCETDKYIRLQNNEGTVRSKYPGV